MKVYVAVFAHQIVGVHPTMRKARDAHFSQEALTNVAIAYYEAKGKGWKNYEGNEIQVFDLELEGVGPPLVGVDVGYIYAKAIPQKLEVGLCPDVTAEVRRAVAEEIGNALQHMTDEIFRSGAK